MRKLRTNLSIYFSNPDHFAEIVKADMYRARLLVPHHHHQEHGHEAGDDPHQQPEAGEVQHGVGLVVGLCNSNYYSETNKFLPHLT